MYTVWATGRRYRSRLGASLGLYKSILRNEIGIDPEEHRLYLPVLIAAAPFILINFLSNYGHEEFYFKTKEKLAKSPLDLID